MRRATTVVAAVCALAVVALLGVSLVQRTELAFTPGIAPAIPVAKLPTGAKLCQWPLQVPPGGAFDRVVVSAGGGRDVELTLERTGAGGVLRRATVPTSARVQSRSITVERVPDGTRFDVCITNRGGGTVEVLGNADTASRTSSSTVDGKPTGLDMTVRFEREPRSMFSLIGDMLDRASLFKASWFGAWTYWLLTAAVLVGVPLLLVRAVRRLEE